MQRLPLFLLYIIGVTLIVLAMAFRSIVISATAAITTILSAFVGFGVLTLVVQEGHLLGLTGLDRTGPIETFVPPIAFAILFGLSMDYMVFLMSRIREEHVHGLQHPRRGRARHRAIGRVVVAAAIIMGTVFAAFILSADRIPKEFGLLLAVAILTRRADRADDARAVVPHAAGREVVVHPALARPAAPEHHDRAAARARDAGAAPRGASRTARTRPRRRGPPEPPWEGPVPGGASLMRPAVGPRGAQLRRAADRRAARAPAARSRIPAAAREAGDARAGPPRARPWSWVAGRTRPRRPGRARPRAVGVDGAHPARSQTMPPSTDMPATEWPPPRAAMVGRRRVSGRVTRAAGSYPA